MKNQYGPGYDHWEPGNCRWNLHGTLLARGGKDKKATFLQGRFRTALRLVFIAVRLKDEGVRVFDVSWNELMQFQESSSIRDEY